MGRVVWLRRGERRQGRARIAVPTAAPLTGGTARKRIERTGSREPSCTSFGRLHGNRGGHGRRHGGVDLHGASSGAVRSSVVDVASFARFRQPRRDSSFEVGNDFRRRVAIECGVC